MQIKVELENNKQLDRFISLVKDFEKANPHLDLKNLKIKFKYDLKASGEFDDRKPNSICVNPNRCDNTGEFSFYLICIHEWAHLLDRKFKMLRQYKKDFLKKDNHLILTTYAKREREDSEELAEIIVLYMTNPYLLKLISQKHFDFVAGYFKSPIECTKEHFEKLFETYSQRYKKSIIKRFNIKIT